MIHIGIDVHQKYSEACALDSSGEVKWRRRLPTTEASLRRVFGKKGRCRIVIEASSLSPWVGQILEELGHELVVVNPRRVRLIAESTLKTDRRDAEVLARLSLLGIEWLHPVYQRSAAAQELRLRLKTRTKLVRMRASLIHTVRGCLTAQGYRLRSSTAEGFVTSSAGRSPRRSHRLSPAG